MCGQTRLIRSSGTSGEPQAKTSRRHHGHRPIRARVDAKLRWPVKSNAISAPSRETFVRNLALDAHTDATLTDPGKLLDELHQTAERGYALDQEEFMQGMVAIAVPVMDTEGRFLAALAFHGPTQRVSRDSAVARLDVLQQAASQLSHAILLDD